MNRYFFLGALVLAFPVQAQTLSPLDPQLQQAIQAFDQAASQKDLKVLMNFYSPEFKNNDGLTKAEVQSALEQLWINLNDPQYRTEVLSVGSEGQITTRTQVTGRWQQGRFNFDLVSTLEAQSQWQQGPQGWTLVAQTTTAERTEILRGQDPPKADLMIPAQVAVGKPYQLEAILKKPLDEHIVLGGIAQSVAGASSPEAPLLDGLMAGGLFKKGNAPEVKADQMISLGFVRNEGMYFVSQRIHVD